MKKRILILGSTGSIGVQTLDVVRRFPHMFEITALSTLQNITLLAEQVREFSVPQVFIGDTRQAEVFQQEHSDIRVYTGKKGVCDLINISSAEVAVLAYVGEAGVLPAITILQAGMHLALATKEVMVTEGEEVMRIARENNVEIRPIDSEHSAIWQTLRSGKIEEVERIWLTCSGGPFRDGTKWPLSLFSEITVNEALQHPNWKMGNKITIDSATLMNKALEVIETVRFFGVPHQKITVVVHPESHLHSAVEFRDGSIIGQIGTPDMRLPIAYALFAPDRPELGFKKFDFFGKSWNFEQVDEARFPSIQFARTALERKKCKELNSANEKAVQDFLLGNIRFDEIFTRVEGVLG